MSITATTLSADVSATQTKGLAITSTASGFPAAGVVGSRQIILIDGEYMLLDKVVASGVIDVLMRGYDGTAATAHDVLSNVLTSADAADFPALGPGTSVERPPYVDAIVSVGENGAIAAPSVNTTFMLNKASALGTTTLGTPSKAQNGVRATFTSQTAAAHVITATMEDGTTGGSTTATFTAFKGASMILEAANGIWNVIATQNVTIT